MESHANVVACDSARMFNFLSSGVGGVLCGLLTVGQTFRLIWSQLKRREKRCSFAVPAFPLVQGYLFFVA